MPTVHSLPVETAAALVRDELKQLALLQQLGLQLGLQLIDAGGGSFTIYYLFNGKLVGKPLKSKDHADEMRKTEEHADVLKATGINMLESKGTIADYSDQPPKHYQVIARWFVKYWFLAGCSANAGAVIRQTGKIRAKLHADGNYQLLTAWNKAMRDALNSAGLKEVDYALLSSTDEARLEADCFFGQNSVYFEGNDITAPVGLGIGSSSTQGYGQTPGGSVVSVANPGLGSKPKVDEKEKTTADFKTSFLELIKKLNLNLQGATLFALNSVGYLAEGIAKDLVLQGKDTFFKLVKAGAPVSVDNYLREVGKLPCTREVSLMLGMLQACKEVGIANVVIEKKGSLGKLGIKLNWVEALAAKWFEDRLREAPSVGGGAPALPPTPSVGGGGGAAAAE